jgi:hypothetical protein
VQGHLAFNWENRAKPVNTQGGQKADFLNIKDICLSPHKHASQPQVFSAAVATHMIQNVKILHVN